MAKVPGGILVGRALKSMGVEVVFFIQGSPIQAIIQGCYESGIRLIDVRHEGATSEMAHAYCRVSGKIAACITGAGCDTVNSLTGISNAFLDSTPLLSISGSAATFTEATETFQELDHMGLMRPITKWSWRVLNAERIPEFVATAFRHAWADRPGPVALDFPRDVLNDLVDEDQVVLPTPLDVGRPQGDPRLVEKAAAMLAKAERPVVIAGSGVMWSEAGPELQEFVECTQIPFYTTPLSRGLIPEDHALSFLGARAFAWKEADVVLVVGTRTSMIVHHLAPPFISKDAKIIMVNIDAGEIGHNRPVDIGILGDAKAVLQQLTAEFRGRFAKKATSTKAWTEKLKKIDIEWAKRETGPMYSDEIPIHPLRLCREVRDFLPRDAILVQDGNEILHFGRRTIPGYYPRHSLSPGVHGCMGVAVPFGIGAKLAAPDKPVMVLCGDGSFGMNAIEIDVAVRHNIPVVVVISNNGGWTGLPMIWPIGRLGFSRYDKMGEVFGAWGRNVENPKDIRPALEDAFASGKAAVINVVTSGAKASYQRYTPEMALESPGPR